MRLDCLSVAAVVVLLGGCATYVTPGAGVPVSAVATADDDIAEALGRRPAAVFPVRIALARVQAPGYRTPSNACVGTGRYCVVVARDIETEQDIDRLQSLPGVAGAIPISPLLLPPELNTIRDLRLAAARLNAGMLLVYTLDTRFTVDSEPIGPLAVISLGFLKNKTVSVATTASAVLYDVLTGYVYGAAEYTARETQGASAWSSSAVIESSRLDTERRAFQGLMREIDKLWEGVVREHSSAATG